MKKIIVIFNQQDLFSLTICDTEENVRQLLAGSVAMNLIQNIDLDMFFHEPEKDFIKSINNDIGFVQLLTRNVSYNNMASILSELQISHDHIL